MRKDEIRNALSFMDVATARGRRIAEGRQIDMTEKPYEIKGNAVRRGDYYLEAAEHIRDIVINNPKGITDRELEMVEFIIEQLEDVSRKAFETAIQNY